MSQQCLTSRLTPKTVFILNKVLKDNNKKTGKTKLIENSICTSYPYLSEIYDKENKKK